MLRPDIYVSVNE